MDPNETWRQLLDAVRERDRDRMEELAEALLTWLRSGGFPPETIGSHMPRDWRHSIAAAGASYALVYARKAEEGDDN